MAPALRLAGVRKGYREAGRVRPVLEGIDLEVERGDFAALLGPSGSGKSTLLNLAGGLDVPDEGLVEVAGTPLSRLTERERTLFRGRRIGFVFQLHNLIPTLTVEENVRLPLELRGTADAEAGARARDLLKRVGLGDRAGSWPDRLSGGEQQRVAVARALVHEPELVLADEPTGNLDRETGARVLELMTGLFRAHRTTLILVTHAHEVAARTDRVLELRGGRLGEGDPLEGRQP